MFSALKFVVAGVIVALFGGFLLGGILTTPQGDEMAPGAVTGSPSPDATAFPTGALVAIESPIYWMELNEDQTCHVHEAYWSGACTYAVNGDLFDFSLMEEPVSEGPQVPATYYWDYDGEQLVFEVVGDEWRSDRDHFFSNHAFRLVPDPRVVVVATRDIPPGDPVYQRWTTLSIASASEAGSDALTYVPDVRDSVAAVPISKGQPITPDLLEPPA